MQFFLIVLISILMGPAHALAILGKRDNPVQKADLSFPCSCIDHWFKHERNWIRASSVDGCMALETELVIIWALNKLPKPQFVSKSYPNLACSLRTQQCSWTYSPLDQAIDHAIDPADGPPEPSVARSTNDGVAMPAKEQPSKRASEAVQKDCEVIPATS